MPKKDTWKQNPTKSSTHHHRDTQPPPSERTGPCLHPTLCRGLGLSSSTHMAPNPYCCWIPCQDQCIRWWEKECLPLHVLFQIAAQVPCSWPCAHRSTQSSNWIKTHCQSFWLACKGQSWQLHEDCRLKEDQVIPLVPLWNPCLLAQHNCQPQSHDQLNWPTLHCLQDRSQHLCQHCQWWHYSQIAEMTCLRQW